jgi:hypothetical protein
MSGGLTDESCRQLKTGESSWCNGLWHGFKVMNKEIVGFGES